eukprot:NODE_423_length_7705_cov_0.829871.p1 type:complete len:582 gc:universal NODE_423_length_7705_cov_0.829871:2239-494(-)
MPYLPILPDSLEYIDLWEYTFDIYPKNATNLTALYNDAKTLYENKAIYPIRPFPNVPETIEYLTLKRLNVFGPVPVEFKKIKALYLSENSITGNLTISSPNITALDISSNSFDNLIITNPEQLTTCNLQDNYFDPSNEINLMTLQPHGCTYKLKSTPSIDCPNIIEFARQLNLHLVRPDIYNSLTILENCCEGSQYILCNANRIERVQFPDLNLNGTINATLLPNTLQMLHLTNNQIKCAFPDLSGFTSMIWLHVSSNQLYGPILGKMPPNLYMATLGANQLNGTVPNLNSIEYYTLGENQFTDVENELKGSHFVELELSSNKISGSLDLSGFSTRSGYLFLYDNFIDKVWITNAINFDLCDVSFNLIPQDNLANFTNCYKNYQRYEDTSYLNSCKYVMKWYQEMNFVDDYLQRNCCNDYYGVVSCMSQNVTKIEFYEGYFNLNTVDGYAFKTEYIPPSLESLIIYSEYNQSAKILALPGHVKYFELGYTKINGNLPIFEEGLETLKLTNLKINGSLPPLPSTLKTLIVIYCGLKGVLPPLPPNLTELQIQGNYFIGPLPTFPDNDTRRSYSLFCKRTDHA